MGKQGPCYHCGATSTPLWRNGPPDKPVLCNACGSRWRTKGSLMNYTPLHCRGESVIYEERGSSHAKSTYTNNKRDVKHHKRKLNDDEKAISGVISVSMHQKAMDEEISNRSSSGSAISESDAWFGSTDANNMTGPTQSVVQVSMEHSWKRTCTNRAEHSSVENLTKYLHTILQEQQSSSCFSGTSDEDLLLERQMPTGTEEIGHGAILIRHQSKSICEEGRFKDYKDIKTLPGRQISPSESTITGSNPTRSPIRRKGTCHVENQKGSVKVTVKSPERFEACVEDKEPAEGGPRWMDSFMAVDDGSERDLLLNVPCNGSFPEGELLHSVTSFGSRQASNAS